MRTLRAAFCAALISIVSAASAAPAAHSAACPAAVTTASVTELRDAVLCLHNRARSRNGLAPLRAEPSLQRAAQRHAAHMVAAGFMAHTTPAGTTLVDRVRGAGYLRPGDGFLVGENLAYGLGAVAAPRPIFRRWMSSPEHRREILTADFRDIGIGAARGTPTGAAGLTFAVAFGVRR